jgi:hypothetical protein
MITERQEREFIAKLIQLTQAKRIEWKPGKPSGALVADPTARLSSLYETTVEGEALRVYQVTALGFARDPHEGDLPYWPTQTVLEFVDGQGEALWAVRSVSSLHDLLRSIQFVADRVRGRIDRIMKLTA